MSLILALALAADVPPSAPAPEPAPHLSDQLLEALGKVAPHVKAMYDDLQGGSRAVEAGTSSRAPVEVHGPCTAEGATRFWTGAIYVAGPLPLPKGLASTLWLVDGPHSEKLTEPLPAGTRKFRLDVEYKGACRTAQVLQQTCPDSPDATGSCTRCPSGLSGDIAQVCRAVDYVDGHRYFDLLAMLDDKGLHPEVRAYVLAALKGGELE